MLTWGGQVLPQCLVFCLSFTVSKEGSSITEIYHVILISNLFVRFCYVALRMWHNFRLVILITVMRVFETSRSSNKNLHTSDQIFDLRLLEKTFCCNWGITSFMFELKVESRKRSVFLLHVIVHLSIAAY